MNALVSIRSNASGLFSPTQAQRAGVTEKLEAVAASRAGNVAVRTAQGAEAASTQQTTAVRDAPPGGELGKDAFLHLLVLQMQNQDPLEPIENTELISQLAQFSALEAQTNLNKNFEALSGNVDQLNFISAAQLLGQTVTGVDLNGELKTGVVDSVHLDGSLVVLSVDGSLMSMAGIVGIEGLTSGAGGSTQAAPSTTGRQP